MKVWSRVVLAAVGVAFALSATAAFAAQTVTPATPSAPRNLKATAGDQRVTLTWSRPTSGTPVFYQVTTTPADFPRTSITTTSITATPLTNGTAYSFAVRAFNGSAYGPSARISATPHATPPGPPTNVSATPGPSTGDYTLTWSPPTSTGSSPDGSTPTINHYTVRVSPTAACNFLDPTQSCLASNLADNVTYTFSVTATNSRNVTGPAATVFAPLPAGATIGLQPTAGVAKTNITASGQLFLKNESITLYWDTPTHVAASVVTDDNGAFTKVVRPFSGDKPKVHKLCASVPPKPCANFTLQPPPTPTPATSPSPLESPTPSPVESAPASGTRPPSSGGSGLDFITRPPFVFLPLIGILGLLVVLAYWLLTGRRRPPAPTSATVVHRATRPDYMAPFPTAAQPSVTPPVVPPVMPAVAPPPPVQPPLPAPAPPVPPVPPAPSPEPVQWPEATPPAAPPPPPTPPSPPAPPTWPAAPDEPPDLPEPSD